MDKRPIGIFDSGLGGMTAAKVLEELLPGEDLIYFGDSGRMPYGVRPREEIVRFAMEDAAFLDGFGVKAFLVACGTITSNALEELRGAFSAPFFGVVDAACRRAAGLTRTGRVGVIATQASVRSGVYGRGLLALDSGLRVFSKACVSFPPLVEQGHFRPGDPLAEQAVREELEAVRRADVDVLILGCTHFPLLEELISAYLGPGVTLVSAGAEAARELAKDLEERGLLSGKSTGGSRSWYTSGDTAVFASAAGTFLGHPITPARHVPDGGELSIKKETAQNG